MKIRRVLAVVVLAASAAGGLDLSTRRAWARRWSISGRLASGVRPGRVRVPRSIAALPRGALRLDRHPRGPSDRVVGDARLQVALRKVFTATGSDGGPGYGAARERYDLRNVTEVVDTRIYDVDAEDGGAAFGIGLVRRQPFRVFTLRNPSRLVIDIGSRFAARRVAVYLSDIERRPGDPAIVAVGRSVDTPAVARGALQRLFAGPTSRRSPAGCTCSPDGSPDSPTCR